MMPHSPAPGPPDRRTGAKRAGVADRAANLSQAMPPITRTRLRPKATAPIAARSAPAGRIANVGPDMSDRPTSPRRPKATPARPRACASAKAANQAGATSPRRTPARPTTAPGATRSAPAGRIANMGPDMSDRPTSPRRPEAIPARSRARAPGKVAGPASAPSTRRTLAPQRTSHSLPKATATPAPHPRTTPATRRSGVANRNASQGRVVIAKPNSQAIRPKATAAAGRPRARATAKAASPASAASPGQAPAPQRSAPPPDGPRPSRSKANLGRVMSDRNHNRAARPRAAAAPARSRARATGKVAGPAGAASPRRPPAPPHAGRAAVGIPVPNMSGPPTEPSAPWVDDQAPKTVTFTLPWVSVELKMNSAEVVVLAPTKLLLAALPPRDEDPLLSPRELATLEGVCVPTARAWERHGCPVEARGGRIAFRRSAFRAWAAEHLVRDAEGRPRYRRGTRPISGSRIITSPTATEIAVATQTQQGNQTPPDFTLLRLPPYPHTIAQLSDSESITLTAPLSVVEAQLPKPPQKRDMTTAEIAAYFRVAPKTVLGWRGPDCPADFVGRQYLWCKAEVKAAQVLRHEARRGLGKHT